MTTAIKKPIRGKHGKAGWTYEKETPTIYNDLDGNLYTLYDPDGKYITTFGKYNDMVYYIETGVII